jgi:AcrR family transcriptional regulator
VRVETILNAAAGVFSTHGFAATSMRTVARATGASVGSIYYHFENKEAILGAILCDNFRRVMASLDARLEGIDDPREAVSLFVENHIDFFAHHLDAMRVMSHELDTLQGEAGAEVAALRRAYTKRVQNLLAALRPDLGPEDVRVATLALFGMVNWTYRWFHTLPKRTDAAALGRQMAAIYLDGYLQARPGA